MSAKIELAVKVCDMINDWEKTVIYSVKYLLQMRFKDLRKLTNLTLSKLQIFAETVLLEILVRILN